MYICDVPVKFLFGGTDIMLKKTVSFLLAALLLTSVVSCADTSEEVFDRDFEIDKEETVDLSGGVYAFGSNWLNEWVLDVGTSDSGDKMNARYKEIEERFGVTFNLLNSDYCSETAVMSNMAAGLYERVPDAMDIAGNQAYSMYKKGLLYPFDEITTIDVTDEKFGSHNFVCNGASWDGHRWCVYPNNWQLVPQFASTLIYNNETMSKLGYGGKIREYTENGQWTWQNFEDIVRVAPLQSGTRNTSGLHMKMPAGSAKAQYSPTAETR